MNTMKSVLATQILFPNSAQSRMGRQQKTENAQQPAPQVQNGLKRNVSAQQATGRTHHNAHGDVAQFNTKPLQNNVNYGAAPLRSQQSETDLPTSAMINLGLGISNLFGLNV